MRIWMSGVRIFIATIGRRPRCHTQSVYAMPKFYEISAKIEMLALLLLLLRRVNFYLTGWANSNLEPPARITGQPVPRFLALSFRGLPASPSLHVAQKCPGPPDTSGRCLQGRSMNGLLAFCNFDHLRGQKWLEALRGQDLPLYH